MSAWKRTQPLIGSLAPFDQKWESKASSAIKESVCVLLTFYNNSLLQLFNCSFIQLLKPYIYKYIYLYIYIERERDAIALNYIIVINLITWSGTLTIQKAVSTSRTSVWRHTGSACHWSLGAWPLNLVSGWPNRVEIFFRRELIYRPIVAVKHGPGCNEYLTAGASCCLISIRVRSNSVRFCWSSCNKSLLTKLKTSNNPFFSEKLRILGYA